MLTRFQKDNGEVVRLYKVVEPHSRATIEVEQVAGMSSTSFSTLIEADVQVVADRTMSWDDSGYGGHAERGTLDARGVDLVSRRRRDARQLRSLLPDSEPG